MPRRRTYDIRRSYAWNYQHPPTSDAACVVRWPGRWSCCDWSLSAPLAIAAGPLLNGAWLRYYAQLGFDLLTYKTVRCQSHACYEMPNLQPVACDRLERGDRVVAAATNMKGSWAVSFGMPSPAPSFWQSDLRATREQLKPSQALSVSVVATPGPGWTLPQIAEDYANCSCRAVTHGANLIELNLSCPNVTSLDGQLYRNPAAAAHVADRVRDQVGRTPILLKIGQISDARDAVELVEAVGQTVSALVMVNCIPARVQDQGMAMFQGQARGIAGTAIHEAAVRQVELFRNQIERIGVGLELVGCGGVRQRADVQRFLNAGATCVQLATAVMIDAEIGLRMREEAAAMSGLSE